MPLYTSSVNDFAPETRSLVSLLQQRGFTIVSGFDGENEFKFEDCDAFFNALITCGEGWLRIVAPNGDKLTLWLETGNEPGELVADYGASDELECAVDAHYSNWCNRTQPTHLMA